MLSKCVLNTDFSGFLLTANLNNLKTVLIKVGGGVGVRIPIFSKDKESKQISVLIRLVEAIHVNVQM